jgi:hypothetical protein
MVLGEDAESSSELQRLLQIPIGLVWSKRFKNIYIYVGVRNRFKHFNFEGFLKNI